MIVINLSICSCVWKARNTVNSALCWRGLRGVHLVDSHVGSVDAGWYADEGSALADLTVLILFKLIKEQLQRLLIHWMQRWQ